MTFLRRSGWHTSTGQPAITGAYVSDIGSDTFTVNFATTVGTKGWVEYGLTSALGSRSSPSSGSSHAIVVTGLTADTTYHYQAVARGRDGTVRTTLATVDLAVVGPAPIISNIVETELTETSVRIAWSVNEPCTGQVHWGTVSGGPYPYSSIKEASLTYSAHSQPLGTANATYNPAMTAGTTYYYQIESSDSTGQTAYATGDITTLGSGVTFGLYGNPNYTCGLQDIGTNFDPTQTVKFRAHQTSTITKMMYYIIGVYYRTGVHTPGYDNPSYYAGGTGGTMRWTLHPDDGTGRPAATQIGNAVYADPYAFTYLWQSEPDYPVTGMSGWSVTAGNIYHAKLVNDDPTPELNWVSPDWSPFFAVSSGWVAPEAINGYVPRFDPAISDDRMSCLSYSSGQWLEREACIPIIQIDYANGEHDGFGYVNLARAPGASPLNPIITSTAHVCERFTVTGGDKVVDGLNLRAAKVSGTVGNLVATLKTDAGVTAWTKSIAPADVPTWTSGDTHGESLALMTTQSLGGSETLVNGTTYRLILSNSGAGTYYMWNGKNGYGYDLAAESPMVFGDADPGTQYSSNSGTSWTTFAAGDYDMMFYFTLA